MDVPTQTLAENRRMAGRSARRRAAGQANPGLLRAEASARRVLRALWDDAETRLDRPLGRPVLRALSATALAIQYRDRCRVRWSDGAWEYRWPDAVVLSDRALLVRARPAECGRPAGLTIEDDFLWDYLPTEGDVVFDVGAGIGTELYALAELVGPRGRVYAFEPHPKTFRVLERACRANGWEHVEPIQAAVAEASGTVTITDDRFHETNDILRHAAGPPVPCYALDDFVAERGIERIDFIKMNIEGAERLAIRRMANVAAITRHMAIACHDFLGESDKSTKADVREWLDRSGFHIREHVESPSPSIRDFLYASR
jgi:FkbM family methyltransferase